MTSYPLMRLYVPDKSVKFYDPRLNRSSEIRPKAVGCGIFCRFSYLDKCQSDVASHVISGVGVDQVGVEVRAKFDASRLNGGQIIRLFGRPDLFYAFLCSI